MERNKFTAQEVQDAQERLEQMQGMGFGSGTLKRDKFIEYKKRQLVRSAMGIMNHGYPPGSLVGSFIKVDVVHIAWAEQQPPEISEADFRNFNKEWITNHSGDL